MSFFRHTNEALDEFQPDAVVYNAGTDILEGDPLGNLSITAQVRQVCVNRSIPTDLLDDKQETRDTR